MKMSDIISTPRGRIGLGVIIVAIVILVLSFCAAVPARAEGFGLGVTKEVTHDESTLAVFLDYTAPFWSAYAGRWNSDQFGGVTNLIGAEYRRHLGPLFAGIGAAWLDQLTPLNGTQWNFSVTIGWDFGPVQALCRHTSHGRQLGIEPDKPNGGWNWCGGRLEF